MSTSSHAPTLQHKAFRDSLIACMREHGSSMDAADLLAVASHFVGQLIALQDQRKWTSEKIMAMVSANIEQGNQEVIGGLLDAPAGGNA